MDRPGDGAGDDDLRHGLARHPRQLFLLDEIGDFLREFKNLANERRPDEAEQEFQKSGATEIRESYDGNARLVRIIGPVTAKRECFACHKVKEGELMATVAVNISLEELISSYSIIVKIPVYLAFVLTGLFFFIFYKSIDLGIIRPISRFAKSLLGVSMQITGHSREQVSASTQQASSLHETMATSHELVATAKAIDENAAEVEKIAEQTFSVCDSGNVQVSESLRSMIELKSQIDGIAKKIIELGESSRKIGGIVDIIDEISDQTNLLALNASIEATAAGEAGLRFGVVAQEVRRLADSTMEATKQIKDLISDIQNATNSTITVIESNTQVADKAFSMVDRLAFFFNSILEYTKKEVMSAKEIKMSTQQQTTALEQMSTALSEVTEAVNEVVKGAEGIEKLLTDVDEKLKELNEITGRIRIIPATKKKKIEESRH